MENIFKNTLKKNNILFEIREKILNIQLLISIVLFITMFSTIIIQIFYREFFSNNFDWIIEFNRILFSWIVFLGVSYGIGKKSHMKFEILLNKVKNKKLLNLLIEIITLIFFLIIVIQGQKMLKFASKNMFSTLPLSFLWMYLPTVICGVLSSILSSINILELIINKEN